jgi:hypothetical protein
MTLDFYRLSERQLEGKKTGEVEIFPDFKIVRSEDLMVDGKAFTAIWDEEKGMWSTDEYDVQRLIDKEIDEYKPQAENIAKLHKKYLGNWSTNSWMAFRNYVGHLSSNRHQLDENLTFANSEVKKKDYVSKRLPYALQEGDISAYDELMTTLYSPEERAKLEWAIGAIMAGDSKTIQKYIVLYGGPGTGKSTWLLILQMLTEGYFVTFDAKQLTSSNNGFAAAMFASNPLVAIQHDGDLSRIEDNTLLNSIVSHEVMTINEKYKASYDMSPAAMLFMGTNKAVKITDAKSGQTRRMIDVKPTGNKIAPRRYQILMQQIKFELGAIAAHCLETYRSMGKDYYSGYIPEDMMLQTDVFFNFVEWHWDDFKALEGISLTRAYDLYKEYCKDSNLEYQMPRFKFREELKNYFNDFQESHVEADGSRVRGWYSGFNADKFKSQKHVEDDAKVFSLVMDETESLLDDILAKYPAQYAVEGTDEYLKFWDRSERIDSRGRKYIPAESRVVSTTLADIDTHREHYVKVPENHIVIDFDLKDADGNKSAERNLEAASRWPSTYAEFSKSGAGIHLHYWYDGEVSDLSRVYDDGIEIKVFTGNSSLRRMLRTCNNVPVATISGGLPLKEKKVLDEKQIASEKNLREMIERNLRKEIHPGTKSSVDFIHKILEDAYSSGLVYDVTDMRNRILAFANNSTNQPLAAIKVVSTMRFASEVTDKKYEEVAADAKDAPLVFFDVEVFPNLFMICWKYENVDNVTTMINPTPKDIEQFMKFRLIGFNNRRYDNHIIYARYLGYDNDRLYKLSQKLINSVPNAMFGEAYDLSYTDIYDFANIKMSLKKWEIELGIPHKELGLPWDQPVDPKLWLEVQKYCENDVRATEAVFHARKEDWIARQILSDISGLSTNASTQQHTARIVFGDNRRPQEDFIYTDLSKEFKGYTFEAGKSFYRGELVGEGGYVYAEPGMYENVVLLDIASMHPTSIEQLDLFGPYTKNFSDLKRARIAIKRKDFETAGAMFGGRLEKFITDTDGADALAYALKIVINIVYGLTAARFDNSFRDPRNIDNIVAKRGALFMVNCKHLVQELGYQVIHIKTDSIKIVVPKGENPKTIIDAVMEYGDQYGYEFEHEATYEKICLVNDAVFVGKKTDGRTPSEWTHTGAQFQNPYVFKTLFTHEPITFRDRCETKSVTTALWLDFTNEEQFGELPARERDKAFKEATSVMNDNKRFVGKSGIFCPMEREGGLLQREKDGKFFAATGSTGYKWLEAEMVESLKLEDQIDMRYFDGLVNEAVEDISKFGDFEAFVS